MRLVKINLAGDQRFPAKLTKIYKGKSMPQVLEGCQKLPKASKPYIFYLNYCLVTTTKNTYL